MTGRLGAPIANPGRPRLVVDYPGKPQSVLRIGQPSVPRSSPDYLALELANELLGGSFTSRLNINLREKHGFHVRCSERIHLRRRPRALLRGDQSRARGAHPQRTPETSCRCASPRDLRDGRRVLPSGKVSFDAERNARGYADKFWAVALACQKERQEGRPRGGEIGVRVLG